MKNLTTISNRTLAILLMLCATIPAVAQTPGPMPMTDTYGHMGIGTITPDKSALLDLFSTTAGFLMPRMTNAQRNALANPATGLMIFNTDTKTIEFNIGTTFAPIWDPVLTASSGGGVYWQLLGNLGTNPAVNFIGTTDGQPLVVRTNSVERLRVASTGEVGIGTAAPTAGRMLEVAGAAGTANVRFGSASGAANASAWAPGANDGVITADANGDLLKRSAGAVVGAVAWLKTGNGGTIPGTNFLGTTDNTAFEIKVFGSDPSPNQGSQRVMRYEPNAISANITGGYQGNSIAAGMVGGVIAGGGGNGTTNSITGTAGSTGAFSTISGGSGNATSHTYTTIAGGKNNTASNVFATVSGGTGNTASGIQSTIAGGNGNTANGINATIGGGASNTASGTEATIAGGYTNTANSIKATVGGGSNNNASGIESTIAGGYTNTASSVKATVGGGSNNNASGTESTIGGGYLNQASTFGTTVSGGRQNNASAVYSTISGGSDNIANGVYAVVSGGRSNTASNAHSSVSSGELNNASSPFAHVSSGQVNAASDPFTFVGSGQWDTASAAFAAIVGGQLNKASGAFSFIGSGNRNLASKAFTTVSGGDRDTANGDMGTVGGGRLNVITATGVFGTIAGGENNRVTQTWGTVGGGKNNISSGAWSAIGGGRLNQTIGAWASIGGGLNNVADSLSAIPGGQSLKLGGNSFGFNADTTNPTTVTDLSAAAFRSSAYFGNADVLIGNIDNNARDLRFYEPNTSFTYTGTNYTAFQAQTQTGNITYTLPASAAASNGDILTSTTGGVMSWADADSIVTANAWGLSGNSSTNPATNFLGTTNNQAFEIRVDNGGTATEGRRRVMRFEPNATSANIIGGFNGNSVTGGVVGATIAGGGANGATNSVAGHYGVVGGGLSNTASGDTSTVGGGGGNTASGDYSTVGGGHNNVVSGYVSTVGGGNLNTALGSSSTVGGGWTNQASGVAPTVSGGSNNTASGDYPTVSGGINNTASGYASTVGGGGSNTASNTASTVGGGGSNTALGFYSTVGGGGGNIASGDSSTVGGGRFNTASGKASTVGGGRSNVAAGDYATIPGGSGLILTATADRSFGFHANHPDDSWPMTISAPNVAIFSNVDLWLGNNDNAPSELRFFEAYNTAGAFPNTANYTAFKAATTQANDITYTLPATNGTAGQMLAIAAAPAPTTTAATLEWASAASSGWNLTGNGGTTVGTNFLGTTDDEPFEIRVDNGGTATEGRRRVMRFEPNATSANIIGGFNGNSVTTGAVGATIAGGGANGATNSVTDYGVVSGGNNNTASGFASTISGGTSNTASGNRSTVGGGGSNTASSTSSTVGGGGGNTASNNYSTVDGGLGNTASGAFSTVGGGVSNTASNNHATVGGGTNDTASGYASTVGGGFINKAEGDYSAIPGGHSLTLTSTADRSFGFNANTAADDRNMSISASAVAVFGNADLWLANNDGNPSELRFFEAYNTAGAFPNTANYTAFKAATTQANDITYTLPSTNGSAGQVLAIAAAPAPTATAATLEWAAAGGGGSGWSLTGNASTTPGTNFLGTTDNVAFEIRVNNGGAATGGNQRVMRYESGTTSPNIIGGFNGNTITGSSGSAIGSGGSNGAATINSVSTSNFGVIAGGTGNRIVGSTNVMIGAGLNDTITTSNYSVVGGGNSSSISGSNASVIPGGNYLKIGSNSFGFNGLSTAAQTDLSLTGANFTSVAYFGNAHVLVGNVDGTAREVRFYEPNSSFSYAATNYTGFKAQAQTANVTYTLPAAAPAGAGNGVMTSTAGGTMSWGSHRRVAVAAAGTAHVITDAAITGTNTVIVTVEGTVAFGTVTARGAGTFTVTTNAALTTADFINYVILP